MTSWDLVGLTPYMIAAGAGVLYVVLRRLPPALRQWGGTMAALWLLAAFAVLAEGIIVDPSPPGFLFIGVTIGLLVTGIGALAAFASQGSIDPQGPVHLYYPLFLLALAGAVAVGFSRDLFTIFVAVELSAVPIYALCAYRHREDPSAIAAAMKYLVQGVAGTVTALFGVALLYFHGRTLSLDALPGALTGVDPSVLLLSAVLILAGYGVKLAIVPLHTWLPDAYAKAPAGVTAIMVGATKTGVLIALFLSLTALPIDSGILPTLGALVTLIAIVTMTAGNLLALNQSDLRYILSYSSVAQMGYILLGFGIGLAYNLPFGFTAGLYYAIAYSVMKSGAFIAADAFARRAGSAEVARMRGLGALHPLLGISFLIFVLGLIGVPFTAGFLGKLLLEQAGMVTSMTSGAVLALILALNSAVSLGYYVPVLSTLLFPGRTPVSDSPAPPATSRIPWVVVLATVALAFQTVYLGLFPEAFDWMVNASRDLFPWGLP